jgi:hypothetical protein
VTRQRHDGQVHAGGIDPHARKQVRDDHHVEQVGRREPKGPAGRGRVEALRVGERAAQGHQRAAHGHDQALGAGREQHARLAAHEQRVAQEVAQAPERMAHRGLRDAHPLGRTGDAELARERVERDHQVEVHAGELLGHGARSLGMNGVHDWIRYGHWIHGKAERIV